MTIYDKYEQWRKERRLDQVKQTRAQILTNVMEEVFEAMGYYEDSRKYAEEFIHEHQKRKLDWSKKIVSDSLFIDSLGDIKVFITNGIEQYGYNAEKVDDEIYKEISSRKQCPLQVSEWARGEFGDNKWRKDNNQDPVTLYKADIEGCKR